MATKNERNEELRESEVTDLKSNEAEEQSQVDNIATVNSNHTDEIPAGETSLEEEQIDIVEVLAQFIDDLDVIGSQYYYLMNTKTSLYDYSRSAELKVMRILLDNDGIGNDILPKLLDKIPLLEYAIITKGENVQEQINELESIRGQLIDKYPGRDIHTALTDTITKMNVGTEESQEQYKEKFATILEKDPGSVTRTANIVYSEPNTEHRKASGGNTPLIVAANYNVDEAIDILLASGADITATNDHGDNAITMALARGNTSMAENLAQAMFDDPAKQEEYIQKATTLVTKTQAIQEKGSAKQEDYKQKVAELNEQTHDLQRLMKAIDEGDMSYIQSMQKNDPRIDETNSNGDGCTPLTHAIVREQLGIAIALIEKGANAYKADSDGITPLEMLKHASHLKDDHNYQKLLKETQKEKPFRLGRFFLWQNKEKTTPPPKIPLRPASDLSKLITAIVNDKDMAVSSILENTTEKDLVNQKFPKSGLEITPLMAAISKSNFGIIDSLTEHGAKISKNDAKNLKKLINNSEHGSVHPDIIENLKSKLDNKSSIATIFSNFFKTDKNPPPAYTEHDGPPPPYSESDDSPPPAYTENDGPPPSYNKSDNKSVIGKILTYIATMFYNLLKTAKKPSPAYTEHGEPPPPYSESDDTNNPELIGEEPPISANSIEHNENTDNNEAHKENDDTSANPPPIPPRMNKGEDKAPPVPPRRKDLPSSKSKDEDDSNEGESDSGNENHSM